MDAGKIASQSGHAYLGAFVHASPDIQSEYHSEFPKSPGTKICLKVDTLGQLMLAENAAKKAGLPVFRVVDSGCKNFFDGKPIVTALGIGPAKKDQIKHITNKFKLL
jgi:peptidyl-tRNA hydrolase